MLLLQLHLELIKIAAIKQFSHNTHLAMELISQTLALEAVISLATELAQDTEVELAEILVQVELQMLIKLELMEQQISHLQELK